MIKITIEYNFSSEDFMASIRYGQSHFTAALIKVNGQVIDGILVGKDQDHYNRWYVSTRTERLEADSFQETMDLAHSRALEFAKAMYLNVANEIVKPTVPSNKVTKNSQVSVKNGV